jgi:hypothetical protein
MRRQKGILGYDVTSVVRLVGPDGRAQSRYYFSEYRPAPEVYWVGPGHDLTDLPKLPDGATRVEVDGVEVAEAAPNRDPDAQGG